MDLAKILRIFYTAWMVIFAIVYLTRCKSDPNQIHENIAIDIKMIRPADPVTQTDSVISEPSLAAPVTTSINSNIKRETKPVKLIYLK
jgi:hypothetical protein